MTVWEDAVTGTLDIAFEHFGVPALYTPAGGVGYEVTAVPGGGDMAPPVFGGPGVISDTRQVEIRVSELPAAARGDRVSFGGACWCVQAARRLDPEQRVWTLDLEPA